MRNRSSHKGPHWTTMLLHKEGVPNTMVLQRWHTREHTVHPVSPARVRSQYTQDSEQHESLSVKWDRTTGSLALRRTLESSSLYDLNMRTRTSSGSLEIGEMAFRRSFRDRTSPVTNLISWSSTSRISPLAGPAVSETISGWSGKLAGPR
jgi:hypothetical protein